MVRKLLATTAIASVLATGAFAQTTPAAPAANEPAMSGQTPADTAAPMDATPAPATPGADATTTGTEDTATADAAAPTADIEYMQSLGADQYLATDLEGADIYASSAPDAESAGEIDNFVVGADGTVVAAVVDTGSFLGDESKTVAVPFDKIEWNMGENNELRAVLTATRDELAGAPAFAVEDQTAAGTTTGAGTGMTAAPSATATGDMAATAPATGTTPATGTMAPGVTTTGEAASTDMAAGTTTPAPATDVARSGTAAGGGEYLATVGSDQYLSDTLIGGGVYAGATTDSEKIGDINDLVIASSGQVEAFVVGVGGFLGIGEKDVGVPFDNISMTEGENGEPHAALAATKEQLKNAPKFETNDATNTAATGTGAMAPGAAVTGAATTATGAATGAAATGMAAGTAVGTAAGTAASGMAAGTTGMATDTTDGTQTASTSGEQPSAMMPVTGADLSADTLMGASVYGPDNQTIGSIGDLALTPEGSVDAVIVDVGGFLGIGAKPVAIAMDNLQFMKDSSGNMTLTTQFTQDQLRNAPEYNSDTYADNRDEMLITSPSDIPAAPAATSAETPAMGTQTPAMETPATGTETPAAGTTTQ